MDAQDYLRRIGSLDTGVRKMLKNTLYYIFRNMIVAGLITTGVGVLFLAFYRERMFQSGTFLFTPNKGWTISACGFILLLACWIISRLSKARTILKSGPWRIVLNLATVFLAAAVIAGCVWFVIYLDGLNIQISPEKFSCKNQNSGAAFEWGMVTDIQGNVSSSLPLGKRTDLYSWVNLSLGDVAIHMPLTFFSDPEFIIQQTTTYWSQSKAQSKTP